VKNVEPQKEHLWLLRMVGEWAAEGEAVMGPGQPPVKFTWADTTRPIGQAWIVSEGDGQMPDGSPSKTMLTLGYDPARQRFVGTWLGSMMTYLWIYEGTLDASGKVLTLNAEGPAMSGDKIVKYQDIVTQESDDHRTLASRMLGEDGEWREFMRAHFRRKR
jgi:hypothetical protein